jgi:hypothetical protein
VIVETPLPCAKMNKRCRLARQDQIALKALLAYAYAARLQLCVEGGDVTPSTSAGHGLTGRCADRLRLPTSAGVDPGQTGASFGRGSDGCAYALASPLTSGPVQPRVARSPFGTAALQA